MDFVDQNTRSKMMSAVKGKDTKPELLARSLLHRKGFRFSLHRKDLPGKPDIVFPKYEAVVFVHGCYWHRHEGCARASTPQSNVEFWQKKFDSNVERDRRNTTALQELGWRVQTVWECELKQDAEGAIEKIATWLRSSS